MRGFTIIELLIAIVIILIIAALAVPKLLHSRQAANEADAVASIKSINAAEVAYQATYPTQGFAAQLSYLAGAQPCKPSSASACLL
ncbi:MAG: pili assembly chaperone, partial [Acidobacteria bacterium]